MSRISLFLLAALALITAPSAGKCQLATAGVGVLLSDRPAEAVAEMHVASAPLRGNRAYTTISWTVAGDNAGIKPALITAAERAVGRLGLGAGLLWLDVNAYHPRPIVVATTVVPLPVPRTAVVAIASTQPLHDFGWSLVLKGAVVLWARPQ
jgi:hypothetical protein